MVLIVPLCVQILCWVRGTINPPCLFDTMLPLVQYIGSFIRLINYSVDQNVQAQARSQKCRLIC